MHDRPSKIMQWLKTTSQGLFDQGIGVYIPDYEDIGNNTSDHSEGRLEQWSERLIRWQTGDGKKPLDNPKECGIFSAFATHLDIDCQLAITIVFLIGFAILLLLIFIVFLVFRRRYYQKSK